MGQPAARITDMHVCPMVTGIVPHVGGPIVLGAFNVLTGMLPQARVTDMLVCVGPPDIIAKGSSGVLVNSLPAARIGDITAHGGTIVVGLPTVLIGETAGGSGGGGGGASVGSGSSASGSAAATAHKGLGETRPADITFTHAATQAETLKIAHQSAAPFCEACFGEAGGS